MTKSCQQDGKHYIEPIGRVPGRPLKGPLDGYNREAETRYFVTWRRRWRKEEENYTIVCKMHLVSLTEQGSCISVCWQYVLEKWMYRLPPTKNYEYVLEKHSIPDAKRWNSTCVRVAVT